MVTSTVEAYSLDKGELLWRTPLHKYVPRRLLAGNGMVIVPEDVVSALDATTGHEVWEFKPDANASLGRAALDHQTVYFGTSSHRLYALRMADGRQLWARDLGPGWKQPAVVRGVSVLEGTVYATLEQWLTSKGERSAGWLIALSAKDGTILWRHRTEGTAPRQGLSSAPVATQDLVVAADNLSNALIAMDRRTGRESWRFEGLRDYPGFPEAPIVDGNIVYAGSGDTLVYALTLNTGQLLWSTKLPGSIAHYVLCGRSLLASYQGMAVLDKRTGEIAMTNYRSEDEFISTGFAADEKRVFAGGPKAIYAFACS